MKPAINILTFLLFLNLSAFILAESGTYASSHQPQYTPTQMIANLTLPDLVISGAITVGGILFSLISHTFIGPAILVVWGLGYLTGVGKWLLLGFPEMLGQLGVPWYVSDTLKVVIALAVFIIIVEVTTQRDLS